MPEQINENQEPEIDLLLTRTPFHLPKGCDLFAENRNPSCSHAEIETLIQKRTLNPTDLEIMEILAAFPFLNHHNLRYALESRTPKENRKAAYTDNLKKLKAAGIVLCFCMRKTTSSPTATDDTDSLNSQVSPLRLYALSQSACTYMEKIVAVVRPCSTASGILMVRMAAANQFVLHFTALYKDRIRNYTLQKVVRYGKDHAMIDAILHFFPPSGKTFDNNPVSIILLSVRTEDGWLEKEMSRLRILSHWLTCQTDKDTSPVIIFCVEHISMAIDLHTCIHNNSLFIGEKYYCPDSLLTVYPPLKALYLCETNEQGEIRAIRIG